MLTATAPRSGGALSRTAAAADTTGRSRTRRHMRVTGFPTSAPPNVWRNPLRGFQRVAVLGETVADLPLRGLTRVGRSHPRSLDQG
jgi:hypothetical protein